jgi:acyl carrier protein
MDQELESQIKRMIADHFGIDAERLAADTEVASLGIDSLGMIEFMFEMEDKLKIRMSDSRAPLLTVSDVIAEIDRAVREQHPAAPVS